VNEFNMTIGGRAQGAESVIQVVNPANEEVFASAPDCTLAQLDAAVAAARTALPLWRATPIDERRKGVIRIAEILEANLDELKRLLTREQGKPHADAAGEILSGAQWCRGTATLDLPRHVVEDGPQRFGETMHEPLGVVGAIAPWNFPISLAMFKVAPALLAGNTMVLKPSPFTPLTTLRLGELVRDALPPGTLNVISGGDALGPWMTSHPGFDKIAFTGSTQTGRKVMQDAAATLKRVTLELGGNDAAIVLPDVDPNKVAPRLFWAAFRNSGQFCIATKRMYVHEEIYEPMKRALIDYASSIKVGNGADPGIQLGPLQSGAQKRRVMEIIEDTKVRGGKLLLGEKAMEGVGYFVPVTIVDSPPDDTRLVREEQFGPVLPLLRYHHIEDAIRRANDSEYGLGATVWSADEENALKVAERLEVGTVWINECHYLSPLGIFGGHKQSGVGCEGAVLGLLEFTSPKTVYVRRKAPRQSNAVIS
jgi:acyl-CoA reductase-like NAD-dependent aldehyde dehydrogenase